MNCRYPSPVIALALRRFAPVRVAALVLVAIGAFAYALWPTPVLEIRVGEGSRVVKEIPVAVGDRITYSYIHSVQKSRVDEIMQIAANGHLVVRETVYDVFGAGLPSDVPDGTFWLDLENRKFHISNMSRDIPAWRVRVAFTAQQTLEVHGERMRLDSLAPPTTLLAIGVADRPRVLVLLEGMRLRA